MDKLFKLKERGTNVRTEIIGGVTTFFAMAYIIFVNPGMLSMTGMDYATVLLATCISAAIGSFLTGFMANVPFAQAPGMGLNAFFTFTICFGLGYTWQQALTMVLISGVIFLIIAVSPLRTKIIASIPMALKRAISAGIGLFIALIGLINSGVIVAANGLVDLGNITTGGALLTLIGVILTGILIAWKVKGALIIGIIATTLLGIPLGVTTLAPPDMGAYALTTFFQFDFGGLLAKGFLPLATAIVTFVICDMFDTVGTLIGTAGNAGMLDKNGSLPGGDRALVADAIATCTGACFGTSTVTTFVESSTGIAAGARTGLSSIVVGLLFLVSMIIAPFGQIIPLAATAPALIIVGVLMIGNVKDIDWSDFEVALPAFLTIAIMPFGYSISDGIGFGFISYTLIKVCRGKFKDVPILMYILSALFIVMYVLGNIKVA